MNKLKVLVPVCFQASHDHIHACIETLYSVLLASQLNEVYASIFA